MLTINQWRNHAGYAGTQRLEFVKLYAKLYWIRYSSYRELNRLAITFCKRACHIILAGIAARNFGRYSSCFMAYAPGNSIYWRRLTRMLRVPMTLWQANTWPTVNMFLPVAVTIIVITTATTRTHFIPVATTRTEKIASTSSAHHVTAAPQWSLASFHEYDMGLCKSVGYQIKQHWWDTQIPVGFWSPN